MAAPTSTQWGCWTSLQQREELNFLKVYHNTTYSWNILFTEDIVLVDYDVTCVRFVL